MLETLAYLDQELLLAINSLRWEAMDPTVLFLSKNKLIWLPLYLGIIYMLIRTYGLKRGMLYVLGAVMAVSLADYICASGIRPYVQRLRPSNPDNPIAPLVHLVAGYRSGSYGFPSCHGANCLALATYVALTLRRRWATWLMFAWAAFMCWSRTYLGVHYPGDLIVGGLVGSALAYASYRAVLLAQKRINIFVPATMLALLLYPVDTQAQDASNIRPAWNINFESTFDNREGSDRFSDNGTYFLSNLDAVAGLRFGRQQEHFIAGGVAYVQPYGCEFDSMRISPTLYYGYNIPGLRFAMGMFPRKSLIEEVPGYILSDSASYFQRNIRGAMVGIEREHGFFQAYIDWRSLKTETQREAFTIVTSGRWQPAGSIFMVGGTAMLNHLARRRKSPSDEYVAENVLAQPYVGVNLGGRYSWADELTAYAGPMLAASRHRIKWKWYSSCGGYLAIHYRYRWLDISNNLCISKNPIFPFYGDFNYQLYEGEPYYAAPIYNRTAISFRLLHWNQTMSLHATTVVNIVDDATPQVQCAQRLTLRVQLGK